MMLCDFHIHSTFSDGHLTIPQIVDLYGSRGFGAIAITDHVCEEDSFLGIAAHWLERTLTRHTFPYYINTLRREAERAWSQYRMRVIPGFELTKNSLVNHRSAHVVVLGVEEYLSADLELTQLTKLVREKGGISIAAHPVSTGKFEPQTFHLWSRREELRHEFDAWEVASGQIIFPEVRESGLPMVANSDMHSPHQMSSWKTVISGPREVENVFDSIREQRLEFTYFANPSSVQLPNTLEAYSLRLAKS